VAALILDPIRYTKRLLALDEIPTTDLRETSLKGGPPGEHEENRNAYLALEEFEDENNHVVFTISNSIGDGSGELDPDTDTDTNSDTDVDTETESISKTASSKIAAVDATPTHQWSDYCISQNVNIDVHGVDPYKVQVSAVDLN
jgi:hypothetical protein